MSIKSIFHYLGWFLLPVIGACLLVICFSYFADSKTGLFLYFLTLSSSLLLLFLSKFIRSKIELSRIGLLLLIVLGWIFLPVFISLPYYFSYYQLDYFSSYYEAASGFLGFGISIFNNPEILNEPLLLWRSSSQWLGGFFYLFTVVSILSSTDINFIPNKYISLNDNSLNFENKFINNFKNIFYCYLLLSLFILFFLNFTGLSFFEKLNLMMTIVSSGGFYVKEFLAPIQKLDTLIISTCFLLSSLNVFIFYEIFRFGKNYNFKEDLYVFVTVILATYILLFIFAKTESFYDLFILITTSISTSGISLVIKPNSLYLDLLLIFTFIGGSLYCTGSGFKLLRILFFAKKFLMEVIRLLNPSIIIKKTIFSSEVTIKNSDYYVASLIFVFYLCFFFLAILVFSFENLTFENVYKLAFLTLNNTLPNNYLNKPISFYDLSYFSHSIILILLVMSKIYFISILVLIKKLFWK